jgi:hypothetical protein
MRAWDGWGFHVCGHLVEKGKKDKKKKKKKKKKRDRG